MHGCCFEILVEQDSSRVQTFCKSTAERLRSTTGKHPVAGDTAANVAQPLRHSTATVALARHFNVVTMPPSGSRVGETYYTGNYPVCHAVLTRIQYQTQPNSGNTWQCSCHGSLSHATETSHAAVVNSRHVTPSASLVTAGAVHPTHKPYAS